MGELNGKKYVEKSDRNSIELVSLLIRLAVFTHMNLIFVYVFVLREIEDNVDCVQPGTSVTKAHSCVRCCSIALIDTMSNCLRKGELKVNMSDTFTFDVVGAV